MADRQAPPATPLPVYVQVEYDYVYQAKDKTVSIRQGESYLLVKKTNQDWWQVRPDGGTKAFYVPAQYVREVHRAAPHRPALRAKPTVLDLRRPSDENLNRTAPEMSSFGRPSPSPSSDRVAPQTPSQDANHNLSSPQHCKLVAELVLLHNNNNQRHSAGDDSPAPGQDRSPDGVEASPPDGIDKRRNDSESGDELSSSSTELMQTASPTGGGRSDSPVYANLQELKISGSSLPPVPSGSPLHLLGDWETHRDPSGRHFYYNRATGERTWKPPRSRDAAGSSLGGQVDGQAAPDSEPPPSEENCPSSHSSQSDSRCGSPPRGWSEELDKHGHTLYVSEHTQEKWIKHVDEQGRPYYYSADGSRSEWELPKYNSSPPPSDILKSRSLERKQPDAIVLTKWRHSTYVLDLNDKPSEKCGVLNVTRITENGKRVRKNWTSSWTILQGSSLLFAKGQGGGATWSFYRSGSFPEFCLTLLSSWNRSVKLRPAVSFVQTAKFGSQSKPEFSVDLRGGSVDWATRDKSSKKHVMELKTRQGTELLVQSDIEGVANDWFRALTEAVNATREECDQALDEDSPESPGVEKENRDKKSRASKMAVSLDSSDQKKTRMKLKKFLIRRPTYQAVRDKGYIKDQVFGCSLLGLCQRENTLVPNFVKMCIDHVENTGLGIDGLYRVSGNLAVIQKLRFAVNHDEPVDLRDGKWEDIHVTTGALKMFFRELSEPLFTFGSFEDFVDAIKNSDYQQRVSSIRDLVKKLPKPNHDTMQLLFQHLRRVIDHGESNRMTTQSVSIVFGPTLLRPETESGSLAVHMVYQNQIVELVLLEYDAVFGR